jgi:hypothetical protein
MDINNAISEVISYAQSNPVIAAVAAVVLLYFLIKKTKILLGLIFMALLLGAVMKIIAKLFEVSSF